MAIEEVKKRFVNEIKLRAYDDQYVGKDEEKEILQIAVGMGVGIDSARGALAQVCRDNGFVLESAVLKTIRDQIEAAMGGDGRIDKKEYDMAVATARRMVSSKKNDREVRKMVLAVMEETGNTKVKTGWFSDWYADEKKDLGLA